MKLYYGQAMEFHGDNAIKHLDFEYYDPVKDINEPCMFWCYFPEDYEYLIAHKGKKFMFWHGSDVLRMIHMSDLWPYMPQIRTGVIHACQNALMHEELAKIGIYALVRPTFWNDMNKYQPCYKYSNKPAVYISSMPGREVEYGEGYMFALSAAFPDLTFHVYGNYAAMMDEDGSVMPVDTPENLIYHGKVEEDVMDAETAKMQICLRLLTHDGFSQTVMKAVLRGQYVVTWIKYEGIPNVKDFVSLEFLIHSYMQSLTNDIVDDRCREQFNNFDYLK